VPAKWTGDVVAALHINGITQAELAAKMGVTVPYISMLLNGKKNSAGAKDRMMEAIQQIKASKAT
jgi:transcriptional regulator with XRE-family HTH domain